MSSGPAVPGGSPELVPGELRGYRRFRLIRGRLWPSVYGDCGPWGAGLEQAVCGEGEDHVAPDPECGCGLYGWYHPSRATGISGFGDAPAVIAARGHSVLGDHGFRSACARIDAVAVPVHLRLVPGAATRAGRLLAERYPATVVYRSQRRMWRDHPPADVSGLGITVTASPSARYVRLGLLVWMLGVLALCWVMAQDWVDAAEPVTWLSLLGGFVAWQALLIWLASRCSEARGGTRGE